ncbi:WXG100 family type VII secretion target [Streptomyces sp. NPDC001339]|uniref:WXG100 family type VII secretion target n=1 Tax=Streptomyces sp. NPDC001339 TaxID=3364563 RepID=UPI0036A82C90
MNALHDVGPKSTGSVALDHACDEFHDSWDDAIKKIAKGTEQIEKKLKATKNNYEETEKAIRDAMSKGGARPGTNPMGPYAPPQATRAGSR